MKGREDGVFGGIRGYGKDLNMFLLKKIKKRSPGYVLLKDELPYLL